MSNKRKEKRKRPAAQSPELYALGFTLLIVAAGTSLLLGLEHLAGLSLKTRSAVYGKPRKRT